MPGKRVTMRHTDPAATGGPLTAEVPEEGVEMMRRAGWTRAPATPEGADAFEQRGKDVRGGGKALEHMTVAELREHAGARGIPIPASATAKAAILESIRVAGAGKGE